jgi:hypothetical protein
MPASALGPSSGAGRIPLGADRMCEDHLAELVLQARQRYAALDSSWCEAASAEAQQAEAAIRGKMLAPGARPRAAFPMLRTRSERQFERWASEEMKRWRAFDAPSFMRRRDYMRDASRPRTGDYSWHDPQREEIPEDTQTIAPAPVAAPQIR